MLMILLFLLGGALAALYTIKWYQPGVMFVRGEILAVIACIIANLVLYGLSPISASLQLGLFLGLLCSCTITDALRSWLPFPLTLPLFVSGLWYVSTDYPWQLTNGLMWAAIWSLFYGVRFAIYRYRNTEDCPGSGDIVLAGVAGLCGNSVSGLVITFAVIGHQTWGTLRHLHIAPFGPWLAASITIQLLYF